MILFIPSGDSAFLLRFGSTISEEIHQQIQAYMRILSQRSINGIVELVPAYCDLTIHYNPLKIGYKELLKELKDIEAHLVHSKIVEGKTIRIPVCYDSDFALDMPEVSRFTGLNQQEIIQKHCDRNYLVYMLGFTPGFCYLGGMDEAIATPRKKEPRQKINAGAVGIAGNQTGIYPIASPGGWQIIGQTPLRLFNPKSDSPFLLEAGNRLQFYSISADEFHKTNEYQ